MIKEIAKLLDRVEYVPIRTGISMRDVPFEAHDIVRVGMIGMGHRGYEQLRLILAMDGVRVTALNDVDEEKAKLGKQRVLDAGGSAPALESDWRALCERTDVDMVYICTSWLLHAEQAIYAMECGKHAAVEVPAATRLEDCWRLVDTSEKTRRHCIMLENTLYEYSEMLVLNLVRAGILGTIVHGEGAYIHEMKKGLFSSPRKHLWRREYHTSHNANLYPTHGLGPIARYMDIHQGDRFTRLVSMSSREAGLSEYRDANFDPDDLRRSEIYACGDMNSSLLQTALGRTVLLQHDVISPRPYSRLNLISGTKGTFCDYPPRIFIEDQPEHDWVSLDAFIEAYESPLWKNIGELARSLGGHGGMDFLMNYRLFQCAREGSVPDMDVYDAAAWSAPGPLSEISVERGNVPLSFPDFTRGGWKDK